MQSRPLYKQLCLSLQPLGAKASAEQPFQEDDIVAFGSLRLSELQAKDQRSQARSLFVLQSHSRLWNGPRADHRPRQACDGFSACRLACGFAVRGTSEFTIS